MKTYKSKSTVRPDVWDKSTCPGKVFYHTNIVETSETEDEETVTMYEYDTTEYTNKEYIVLLDSQLAEQADALIELADILGGE